MKTRPMIFHRHSGVTLIEVLVTLVILLVGLLGLAGTMMHSQRSEAESYQRVQALVLLQDMVERINANRKVASCYAITTDAGTGAPSMGTNSAATPACTSGTATQNARAVQDLTDWSNLLLGAAETTGSGQNANKVGAMAGARGCINYNATTGVYLISVAWQGIGKTAAPPSAWTCAKGEYGNDDAARRVVSVTLQVADLAGGTP